MEAYPDFANLSPQEIAEQERHVRALNHRKEMGEKLERLRNNSDFQDLIEKGYLDKALKDNVELLTRMTSPDMIEQCNRTIFAIGFFKSWMDAVDSASQSAEHELRDIVESNQELLAEANLEG